MRRFGFRKVAGIILIAIAGIIVFGNVTMLLWNALMPVIFHLPLITFWQALGLLLLSKLLFGGFKGGPRFRDKRDNLRQAWMNMNPEQREKFKQEWGQRRHKSCRGDGPFEQWGRFGEGGRGAEAGRGNDSNRGNEASRGNEAGRGTESGHTDAGSTIEKSDL